MNIKYPSHQKSTKIVAFRQKVCLCYNPSYNWMCVAGLRLKMNKIIVATWNQKKKNFISFVDIVNLAMLCKTFSIWRMKCSFIQKFCDIFTGCWLCLPSLLASALRWCWVLSAVCVLTLELPTTVRPPIFFPSNSKVSMCCFSSEIRK